MRSTQVRDMTTSTTAWWDQSEYYKSGTDRGTFFRHGAMLQDFCIDEAGYVAYYSDPTDFFNRQYSNELCQGFSVIKLYVEIDFDVRTPWTTGDTATLTLDTTEAGLYFAGFEDGYLSGGTTPQTNWMFANMNPIDTRCTDMLTMGVKVTVAGTQLVDIGYIAQDQRARRRAGERRSTAAHAQAGACVSMCRHRLPLPS